MKQTSRATIFAIAGARGAGDVAAAPATIRGTGATFTGDAVRLPGGTTGNVAANSIAAYIDLPNGIISSLTNMTVEVWANPRSAQNWARILDFGRTTQAGDGLGAAGEYTGTAGTAAPGVTDSSDDLMLTSTIGTDLGRQRFEAKLNGSAVTTDSGLPTTATVLHHYAITFADGAGSFGAAGGRFKWYRDGQFITHLDVNFHLVSIEDVNNWLGRSMFSGDSMSHIYYHEVRIHNAALSDRRVLANYQLGPNFVSSNVTLTADDPAGATSFNVAGRWSDGLAPSAGKSYETYNFRFLTPNDNNPYTFAGASLKVSGGFLGLGGGGSSTVAMNSLTLNGAELVHNGGGTKTVAGTLTAGSEGATIRAANGAIALTASLNGSGQVTCLNNSVTLNGTNTAFTGKMIVGDGRFSSIVIDSEARLGANPAAFTADQPTLNRGVLYTTATMTIDDANRGIRIAPSAGLFNVANGTTLTLAVPISCTASGTALVTTSLNSNPVSGLFIKDNGGTLVLTHPNNSHNGFRETNAGRRCCGL